MPNIKGHCFTNVKGDYDCEIVTVFAAVPRKGERVQCKLGSDPITLSVVTVTHSIREIMKPNDRQIHVTEYEPYIIVELH